MKKGIISAVLCIAAIFAFAVTANAVNESFLETTHYIYSSLDDKMKAAYRAIYNGVENDETGTIHTGEQTKIELHGEEYRAEIVFPKGVSLTDKELLNLYHYYIFDCPEHCWLWGASTSLGFRYHRNAATNLNDGIYIIYYGGSVSKMATMRRDFDAAVTRMLNMRTGTTKMEKALSLHDIVAQEVEYGGTSGDYAHRAYGAIVNKRAVCDGYAYAYQVLLNRSGIKASTVAGYGVRAVPPEPHAWNMVEFGDNKWAYVDVTWDDLTERDFGLYHYYFGLTDDDMIAGVKKDHTEGLNTGNVPTDGTKDHYIVYEEDSTTVSGKVVTNIPYDLPACTAANYKYFGSDKTFSTSSDIKDIAAVMKKTGDNSAYGEFVFKGGSSAFKTWIGSNGRQNTLAQELGIYGEVKFSWLPNIGQEIHLNVYVEGYEHEHHGGTATCLSRAVCSECGLSYGDYGDHDLAPATCTHGMICKLCGFIATYEPDYTNHTYGELKARVPATPQTPGMEAHYECEECHNLFDENKEFKNREELVIPTYTPGDIDGNGAVNNKDVIMLFNYSVNKSLPGVIIDACNPDGEDDGLTNKDIIHLFKYVSRIKNIVLH